MADSETHVQVYTAYKLVEKFVPVTDLSVIETGDELVIYNPGSGMACSADAKSTYYRAATALTPDESGNFVDVDSKLRWTVTADSGVYTFATQDGKKLSVNASNKSLPLGEKNDTWTIAAATTANCFYIINANRNTLYIEYFSQHTEFSTYNYSPSNETIYAMGLYRMTEVWEPVGPAPVGETVATPTATPVPGEVESGTQVSFACATADAVISYKIGDGAYTTYTGPVTITEDTTFTVKATKSGMTDSAEAVFEYTIKEAFSLKEGDKVVIYNPANLKALSQNYTGFYNLGTDVTVEAGKLSGYTASDIWTVGIDADGNYTFSTAAGQKLSMGASYTSIPLDDVNTGWKILPAATENCFYIQNAARGNYLEWYSDKNNWSAPASIGANEALFAQQFYLVADIPEPAPVGDLPVEGDKVVIYNQNAEAVLAAQDDNVDSPSIMPAAATIVDGKAVPANGGVIFTVEKNGDYYRFNNPYYGYLCSNGTGNNAFYSKTASEDADWTLRECSGGVGGFEMESRTAKYNDKYSQWMEYYAGAFKTYSMYNVTDYTIYSFYFYPVADNVQVAHQYDVVNDPEVSFGTLLDAQINQDYTFTYSINALFGVKEIWINVNGTNVAEIIDTGDGIDPATGFDTTTGAGTATIPAQYVTGESMNIEIRVLDAYDGYTGIGEATVTVKDEPFFTNMTPAAGAETGEDKRPTIRADVTNAGDDPTIVMTVNGETVAHTYENGTISYTPAEDMADGSVNVTVTVTRTDGKEASKSWKFTVGEATYRLYFGQLHSHTGEYSDGSGTLAAGLEYIKNLPESANVQFVAFTDHSNYFDGSNAGGSANPEGALYDMSLANATSQSKWSTYKSTMEAFNESNSGTLVAIPGFEMTWSGGPGHINTFATPGIVSRNNETLDKKTDNAGLQAYYKLLSQTEGVDSVSQFNHPGTTFGTFIDFSYWDAIVDTRIYLVEVGNGEGQIGAGGYYPSYEYYTMALDKGWHVAPTNNQDNHKGKWGNANDARDVILTDDFSEEGLLAAIRQYRVYATEDKNLEINYTVNGLVLGSIIEEKPEKLDIEVSVNDPDASDFINKVEVVVNSGKTAYTWDDSNELATGNLTCTLDPTYSYYFIRVTEGDGDIAVTAPVWVGETLKLGISSVVCGTATPVTDEALTITTTLFNSEVSDATVKSVTYTTNGSEVLGTDTEEKTVPASGTLDIDFEYTPTVAKVMTVTVTVVLEQDGVEYEYSMDVKLDVLDASKLVYIGIDASHFNEYVAGNYKDSMGNFGNLAAGYSVRTVELKTSEELLAACANAAGKYKAIILTAPSRRDGKDLRDPYATYSDAEIAALVAFNAAGGSLILAGWSDYYEKYQTFPAEDHMAAQQNKILAALGSSLRVTDDATNDDTLNGGKAQRLYFNTYNMDSFLMEGVEVDAEHPNDRLYTEVFSQYGGASIHVVDAEGNPTTTIPATVTPVVYAHASTYSKDSDRDGIGGKSVPKYTYEEGDDRLMVLATEQIGDNGLIIVSGAAFMSNFEVQATLDNAAEKNYSNYKVCENFVNYIHPVVITPIADVQAQTESGIKYTIKGIVTSNASGYDADTAFFDCVYVEDETAGICCFPVSGNYKVGDEVQITGTTDFYQGEMELQVTSVKLLSENNEVTPKTVTAAQINDKSVLGSLIKLEGTVESFALENGLVQTIMVKDAAGNTARVFIDGYITKTKTIENLAVGATISAVGLSSYDNTFNAPDGPFPRIRVRDRADIVCIAHVHEAAKTEAKDATCTEPGNIAYWYCSVCEKYFSDEACTTEITLADTVISAKRHAWGDWETVTEANCFHNGEEKRVCANCDEKETREIPKNSDHCPSANYKDIKPTAWYHEGVDYMIGKDLMNGYNATTFAPKDAMTRAQMVTLLYRIAGEPAVKNLKTPFTDVNPNSWYGKAVAWAYENKITNGVSATKFAPNTKLTREQMFGFLYNYLGKPAAEGNLDGFTDKDAVHSWAKNAIIWAVSMGYVQGDGGKLKPVDLTNRAETAVFFFRYLSAQENG